MVLAHIKRGDESLFLLDLPSSTPVPEVIRRAAFLHNGRIKILDLCSELEYLSTHGASLPPKMVGLTDDQVQELKLTDDWTSDNEPSGGCTTNKDPCGRRNGQQPTQKMRDVIAKTVAEVKGNISKELVKNNQPLSEQHIYDSMSMLRGAVTIVYPMGLPPYDPIQEHLDNRETKPMPQVIDQNMAQLWFAGKELQPDKLLRDYVGKNEKTKAILKLTKRGQGAPGREPQLDPADQAGMMAYWHKRQQELKTLDKNSDDSYLDSGWADSRDLQKQFYGLDNIKWRPQ